MINNLKEKLGYYGRVLINLSIGKVVNRIKTCFAHECSMCGNKNLNVRLRVDPFKSIINKDSFYTMICDTCVEQRIFKAEKTIREAPPITRDFVITKQGIYRHVSNIDEVDYVVGTFDFDFDPDKVYPVFLLSGSFCCATKYEIKDGRLIVLDYSRCDRDMINIPTERIFEQAVSIDGKRNDN